ncbi:MAG: PAS domain-containing protein, partial [Proteobacteria bacterium]|nr:PAS domain-containing protein [Pseudomonadota bacterium]
SKQAQEFFRTIQMDASAKLKKHNSSAEKRTQTSDENIARFVADSDGRIVYASPAFATLVNRTDDQIQRVLLTELIGFGDSGKNSQPRAMFGKAGAFIDNFHEGVHTIILHGHAEPAQTSMRIDFITAGDGSRYMIASESAGERHAEFFGIPESAFAERVLRLIGREKQETTAKPAKLPAFNEKDMSFFLDMAHDLMAVTAHDGSFLRTNQVFSDLLGYAPAELLEKNFGDITHAEDKASFRNGLYTVARDDVNEGRLADIESRILASDKRIYWIQWHLRRKGDAIYIVGQNITANKLQETMLHKQKNQLNEAQAIGRMGHWHWSVGATDIEWSDEIYRIFGVTRDTYRPTIDNVNSVLHKRDIGRLLQAFQRAIIEQNDYDMDFRIVRPDGGERYVRCEGRCEMDDNGEVTALFGIMQDITDRMAHEQALREAKDAAERAYAAKSQFLANMSHELRTPLNAIIGFSEMMQRQLLGPIGTEKYLDYITGIRESGEHLLDLISDILDMSKIEAGKYELDLEEINVSKVIRLAAHMMEGRAQEGRIKLKTGDVADDLVITADRRAVMQILLNLLSNAVKFTKPGGSVNIECASQKNSVFIKVSDTGVGIPSNKIAYVTRPFEQAACHYTRGHEGTGLGLAITKELTEMHSGILQIESTVGVGTTVTIRLPCDAYAAIQEKARKKRES